MKVVVLLLCVGLLCSALGLFVTLFVVAGIIWSIKGMFHLARPARPRRR